MTRILAGDRLSFAEVALAAGAFSAATVLAFHDSVSLWTAQIIGGAGDNLLLLAILDWTSRIPEIGLTRVLRGFFFFPTPYSLGLVDHLLGITPLFIVLRELSGGNDIVAFNLLHLGSFPLTAVALYSGLRLARMPRGASLAMSAAFAFCPYRWAQLGHFQILWMPGTVLAVVFLDRLLARPGIGRASVFLASYACAVGGGAYLAYWIHLPLVMVLAVRIARFRKRLSARRSAALLATTFAATLAIGTLFFTPYLLARGASRMERSDATLQRFAARPGDLLGISSVSIYRSLWPGQLVGRAERSLFPGFLLSLAGLAGYWRLFRGLHRVRSLARALALAGLFSSMLLFAKLYVPLSHILPGMQSMRVPIRVYPVTLLALAWLGASALQGWFASARRGWRTALAGVTLALLVAELPASKSLSRLFGPVETLPQLPPVWRALEAAKGSESFAALPLLRPGHREASRVWRSRLVDRSIANGHAGFVPDSYRGLLPICPREGQPLTGQCLSALGSLGIGWVVLESPGVVDVGSEAMGENAALLAEVGAEVVFRDPSGALIRLGSRRDARSVAGQ